MVQGKDLLTRRLGNEGYAFAQVKVAPIINDETLEVGINYFINPGKKVYVRRINFTGNYKTNDEVLRREIRLMEGGELSNSKLDRSKVRLQRLPYIEEVIVDKVPVPGTDDLVDIKIKVSERLSGSFNIGAGFSQNQGFVFNVGMTLDNLNGTGEKLAINLSRDITGESYSVAFTDPYYTIDGISRTISASFRQRDTSRQNIANFLQNNYGLNLSYGLPLSEFDRVRIGGGFEHTEIIRGNQIVTKPVNDFIAEFDNDPNSVPNNGKPPTSDRAGVDSLTFLISYTHDTRNRTVFATRGNSQSILLDLTTPGSDIEFYKVTYRNKFYFPVTEKVTTLIRTDMAYGGAYGDTKAYPFYERFFAGGLNTVRGYDSNTLGPRELRVDSAGDDIPGRDFSVGGDIRTVASAELIFPVPFMEKAPSSVRLSMFYDIGNVFLQAEDGFQADELRSSYGVSFVWLAPIGPLRFSYAQTLNDRPGDRKQAFQFSIGSLF